MTRNQTKGKTNKEMSFARISLNEWDRDPFRGTGEVLCRVLGTAGTLTEYCFATVYHYEDGTEDYIYDCPAVEAKGTMKSFANEFDQRQLVITGADRNIRWFLEK